MSTKCIRVYLTVNWLFFHAWGVVVVGGGEEKTLHVSMKKTWQLYYIFFQPLITSGSYIKVENMCQKYFMTNFRILDSRFMTT